MLLISDPEVRQVLSMRDCVEVVERAFAEETRGTAVNAPRTRYKVQLDLDSRITWRLLFPAKTFHLRRRSV